ncbi:unnamed protein product [Lathyrus oleraceus]
MNSFPTQGSGSESEVEFKALFLRVKQKLLENEECTIFDANSRLWRMAIKDVDERVAGCGSPSVLVSVMQSLLKD